VNEAAILAANRGLPAIGPKELDDALARLLPSGRRLNTPLPPTAFRITR